MNRFRCTHALSRWLAVLLLFPLPSLPARSNPDADALEARIAELEAELAEARHRLDQVRRWPAESALPQDTGTSPDGEPPALPRDPFGGRLRIGGAVRVNYAIGSYGEATGAPSPARSDGGNFSLDTFRVNVAYDADAFNARFEYRFFDGYHFLHTAYAGWALSGGAEMRLGVHRVPFGPGPYGVSQSWFFDQHYYLGLADDMDLGIAYSGQLEDWDFDIAFYLRDEGSYAGNSRKSARYSYDVVNESGRGYEERNQMNLRMRRTFAHREGETVAGFSAQYGELRSKGSAKGGDHYAGSIHFVHQRRAWTLAAQLTRYTYRVDAAQPLGTAALVQFGAYDFPNTVAAKGWIPAISLSYRWQADALGWLDSVTPYIEYSSVRKRAKGFNDSQLFIIGAAWARGGWYIYTDVALSDGNEFVGGETAFGDRLGANADNRWQHRLNINFGYYY
ncbi:MAG: carbohydrate porin [Opitutales bacterium]|nr:carbohydrate porin [Opitutales bacterium]